jgi:uncharacterized protein
MINEVPGDLVGEDLCKACGLCCTGQLFIWVKLKAGELDAAEALGMRVYRSDPTQRGFSQPCPLWKGKCTIHETRSYPRTCRAYRCKLLKALDAAEVPLAQALTVVSDTKVLAARVAALLPASTLPTFRERVVEQIEHPLESSLSAADYLQFRALADQLLHVYAEQFGVTDWLEAG